MFTMMQPSNTMRAVVIETSLKISHKMNGLFLLFYGFVKGNIFANIYMLLWSVKARDVVL